MTRFLKALAPTLGLAASLALAASPAKKKTAASKPAPSAEKTAPPALAAPAAAPVAMPVPAPIPAESLTQSESGMALIFGVLSGKAENVTPYLIDSLRAQVTPEVIEGLRSQYSWLYEMLGGNFIESMRGTRVFEDGMRAYYREYQLGESVQRAPLLVVQVLFPDSTGHYAMGMQVKSFLGNEKMISGEKTWKVDGRDVEIHSMSLAEGGDGKFLAISVHDPDTSALDRGRIGRDGPPIIREAVKRGYLDTAKAFNGGVEVKQMVGLVFLRRDPNAGFIHARVAFNPEEYAVGGVEKLLAARADSLKADSAKTAPARPDDKGKGKGKGKGKKK